MKGTKKVVKFLPRNSWRYILIAQFQDAGVGRKSAEQAYKLLDRSWIMSHSALVRTHTGEATQAA